MKEVIKGNNTEYNANSNETDSNTSATKKNLSTYPETENNDTVNAIIIKSKTTTYSIDNNTNTTTTKSEKISKEATTDTIKSSDRTSDVMDTTTVERDDTTPATDIPSRTMAYSQPMYYDYPDRRIDPFDHYNDGLDLNL